MSDTASSTPSSSSKRIFFIGMMGVPGSYDASVYDHLDGKDDEGIWFIRHYGHIPGITILKRNVCIDEDLPSADEVDGLVLAGSYNSVHDNTEWQQRVRAWLPEMRARKIPILAICGSHQLLCHSLGSAVGRLDEGPHAGTFPVELTEAGRESPIMVSIPERPSFHYANSEQVVDVPEDATLLAACPTISVAALDHGDHCYSTQFHPEATPDTLGTVWRFSAPERMENHHEEDHGDQLIENFLRLVADL